MAVGFKVSNRTTLVLLLSICFWFAAQAQLPVDSAKLRYKAGVTGMFLTGNAVQTLIVGSLILNYGGIDKKFGFWQDGSYTFNDVGKSPVQRDYQSRWLLYYRTNPRLFPVMPLWASRSLQQGFHVFNGGLGLNYVICTKPHNYLDMAVMGVQEWRHFDGIVYNDSRFNGMANINTSRAIVRVHGNHTLGNTKTNITYEGLYMPSLRWGNNTRLYGSFGLSIAVYRKLSFQSTLVYTYEQIVKAGSKQGDVNISFGLSYSNM